ncbi:MAG: glycosyltransferase family 4 protein [Saprospiraceae bacterium]|nr:glycosyltransferase family 4 protein [Saprospiraceae bacterium]
MSQAKLKICILGTAYPFKGGIAAFNERMARELISQGHEVEIITFTLQYPSYFYPGKSQFSDEEPPPDLEISQTLNSVNPLSWWKTGRKVASGQYDLIISKFWIPVIGMGLGSSIRMGKKKYKTTAISIIDNIIPHESRPGDGFFRKVFMNSIDGVLTMSQSVAEDTRQLFPETPVSFYPHPIYDIYGSRINKSDAIEHLKLPSGKKFILFFGYIRDYKGLDWLLQSFSMVKDEIEDIDILVAGEYYTDGSKYIDLIKKLDIESRVHMHTDFIPGEKVHQYFSACDLVAQTYKSATQSGISQIAIHFELPMLSTKVGGLAETVEEGTNGILVNPDLESISKGMVKYFQNPSTYYQEVGCKEIKKKYSWSSFIHELLDLYHKIKQ